MDIVDVKDNLHDGHILALLSYSHYMPTDEKLNALADKYEADADTSAFACADDGTITGVIVIKRTDGSAFEITSIAVEPAHRKCGIASRLIAHAAAQLQCTEICAETDDDAVDFYRKTGFEINPLGEKYPGFMRYLCVLRC